MEPGHFRVDPERQQRHRIHSDSGAKAGDDDSNNQQDSNVSTGTTIGLQLSEDEWLKVMEGARTIIGAEKESDKGSRGRTQGSAGASSAAVGGNNNGSSNNGMTSGLNFDAPSPADFGLLTSSEEIEPYIEGIRSVGIITAGGKPLK